MAFSVYYMYSFPELPPFIFVFISFLLFFLPQIFAGNSDSDEEALTVFDPPLFGRYLRIHPRGWINDIALRLEVLGCATQQDAGTTG